MLITIRAARIGCIRWQGRVSPTAGRNCLILNMELYTLSRIFLNLVYCPRLYTERRRFHNSRVPDYFEIFSEVEGRSQLDHPGIATSTKQLPEPTQCIASPSNSTAAAPNTTARKAESTVENLNIIQDGGSFKFPFVNSGASPGNQFFQLFFCAEERSRWSIGRTANELNTFITSTHCHVWFVCCRDSGMAANVFKSGCITRSSTGGSSNCFYSFHSL